MNISHCISIRNQTSISVRNHHHLYCIRQPSSNCSRGRWKSCAMNLSLPPSSQSLSLSLSLSLPPFLPPSLNLSLPPPLSLSHTMALDHMYCDTTYNHDLPKRGGTDAVAGGLETESLHQLRDYQQTSSRCLSRYIYLCSTTHNISPLSVFSYQESSTLARLSLRVPLT